MSDIYQKFAAARAAFPESLREIEADEERVRKLLATKAYASLPETQDLIEMCRKRIVSARVALSRDRGADQKARDDLWIIIDGSTWVLDMLAKDFDAELAQIERDMETELSR